MLLLLRRSLSYLSRYGLWKGLTQAIHNLRVVAQSLASSGSRDNCPILFESGSNRRFMPVVSFSKYLGSYSYHVCPFI